MPSMRKTSATEATEFKNGAMTAHEYELGEKAINIARIRIDGRYPAHGWATNEEVTELCYVLEGEGTLHGADAAYPLGPGDALLIQPGERFYWEGNIAMLVTCTPAWTLEQYKHLDN